MASILCLAHYCDTHGPTPLMVTEGLPVPCAACMGEGEEKEEQPRSSRRSLSSPDDFAVIRRMVGRTISTSSEKDHESLSPHQHRHPHRLSISSLTISTPPESPRLAALQAVRSVSHPRRDSSFRKTYDENDKKRAIPCENCALTLPPKVDEQSSSSSSGSPTKSAKPESSGPTLRTRMPYERISHCYEESSTKSNSSDSEESEQNPTRLTRVLKRTPTCTSVSSFASSASQSHTHHVDYTSTHDPLTSASFSTLRASCLRTLSCETLPPSAATNTTTSPTTPTSPLSWTTPSFSNRSFPGITSASSSAMPSTSGGPIFFGDPTAGYTTAYIFRIPDPHARGRRRIYAFICLSSAHERAAMRAFSFLSAAFRDLAAWIQSLAELEAERLDPSSSTSTNNTTNNTNTTNDYGPRSPTGPPNSVTTSLFQRSSSTTTTAASYADPDDLRNRHASPRTSAFLSGRSSCDPDNSLFHRHGALTGGAGNSQIRSRGLAELVGRADFYIQLHVRFVALMAQLSVLFTSGG